MRLVVLDTNIVVSAGLKLDSAPAKIIMDWALEGLIQVVTCPSIISEYRDVSRRPKFRSFGFPPLWLEFLIEESLYLPDPNIETPVMPDPDDAIFLKLALNTGAWLVNGNLKHFSAAGKKWR